MDRLWEVEQIHDLIRYRYSPNNFASDPALEIRLRPFSSAALNWLAVLCLSMLLSASPFYPSIPTTHAASGRKPFIAKPWAMSRRKCSPHYTTRWEDLPRVG